MGLPSTVVGAADAIKPRWKLNPYLETASFADHVGVTGG